MPTINILRVTSKRAGFRRAGIVHATTPTDHPVDTLSDLQIEQLLGDPMLHVEEAEVEAPAEAKEAKPAAAKPKAKK